MSCYVRILSTQRRAQCVMWEQAPIQLVLKKTLSEWPQVILVHTLFFRIYGWPLFPCFVLYQHVAKTDRFLLSFSCIFLGMLHTANLVRCLESQLTYEDLNNLRNIKLFGDWREKQKEEDYLGRHEHRGKYIIRRALHQITLARVCTFMLLPTENAKGLFHSSAKWRQTFLQVNTC